MKKYVIITNDRGTVVGAKCYRYVGGYFVGRDEHKKIDIPFTPKKKDRLHFNEKFVDKDEYENVLEYIQALEELEEENLAFLLNHDLFL